MEIDLNEENYDYESLLNLFSLPNSFDVQDLKVAKKKVLLLHPDKSGLDMKYFVFFYKMYQKVLHIYQFVHHETDIQKVNKNIEIQSHFKDYLDRKKINPIENYKLYSKEFNAMFEQIYVKEGDDGYDEWIKSNEDFYDKDNIEASRQKAVSKSALIEKKGIEGVSFNKLGSNHLQAFDVKESHSNPILNIDIEKTYNETPKFRNVQEYQMYLRKQDNSMQHFSQQQSEALLQQKHKMLDNQAKSLAYTHMVRQEKIQNNYNNYVSKYLQLEK